MDDLMHIGRWVNGWMDTVQYRQIKRVDGEINKSVCRPCRTQLVYHKLTHVSLRSQTAAKLCVVWFLRTDGGLSHTNVSLRPKNLIG